MITASQRMRGTNFAISSLLDIKWLDEMGIKDYRNLVGW
jgi:hypothetical protein